MKFLLRLSPDVTIKADKTRRRFLRVLIQNLRDAFANEGIAVHVEPGWVRLVVDADQERAGEVARRVFGVHSVSRVDEHALGTLEELVTTDEEARAMATWSHSGFHVNHSVRLEADDACGILQLARYSARAPVSLERLRYDPRKQQVTLQSDKREGPTAGTHVFPALEFLARLLAHVPDPSERLTRAYGAYSVRRRARWRLAGILADTRPLAAISSSADDAIPDWPALRVMRQRWAALLKRIYEVDPLACPRCGAPMRILAFIFDEDVITAILHHLRSSGRDPRALPEHVAAADRAPP